MYGKQEMQPERDYMQRTTRTGPCANTKRAGTIEGDIKKYLRRQGLQDPLELFQEIVCSISLDMNLGEEDINTLHKKTNKLKNIEKMNPTAYILGYLFSKDPTVSNLNNILNIRRRDPSIEAVDIIRYSRHWDCCLK